jgi:monoamine oxidase
VNRREFLALASAAPGPTTRRRRIIVAGAGLAGLSCAYELQKRGCDVVVLEGRGRAGGRVETLREGLGPGLTAETGATRIPDNHHLTLSYTRQFGLSLETFKPETLADVVHLRGRSYSLFRDSEPNWPLALRSAERRLGRKGMTERYLSAPLTLAKGAEDLPRVPEQIRAADPFTIYEYLASQGLSDDAIQLITVGVDTTMSAALFLLVEFNQQGASGFFHIRGGNDRLPEALARRLAGQIRYGCRVTSIGQDERSAWTVIERAGSRETVRGDHVVSTLPFSVARQLFNDARLSSDKQRVIREQKYFAVDKVFLQMRKQFWRMEGLSGFANTDLLSERFWSLGPDAPNQRGLLLSYVVGSNAAQLDELDEDRRLEVTLTDAERVFCGSRENFEVAKLKSWSQDPWQRGGLSRFDSRELDFIPISARKEGRIHFAGEHTSRWNGWMQGAFESAHRVVKELVG